MKLMLPQIPPNFAPGQLPHGVKNLPPGTDPRFPGMLRMPFGGSPDMREQLFSRFGSSPKPFPGGMPPNFAPGMFSQLARQMANPVAPVVRQGAALPGPQGPIREGSGGPIMGGGGGPLGTPLGANNLLSQLSGRADPADAGGSYIPRLGQPSLYLPPDTGSGFRSPTGQAQYGGVGGNPFNFTLPDSWGGEGGSSGAAGGMGLLDQLGRDFGRGAYSVYDRMREGGGVGGNLPPGVTFRRA